MPETAPDRHGSGPDPSRRARRGFTLVEVLVAATLGALLLVGVASAAMGLSQTVAQLESDSVNSVDNVMARITREVRYAWWVTSPHRNLLVIADENNRMTEYYRVGNSLIVRLPGGTEGSVLTGLDAVNFSAETTNRLRDAAARQASARVYSVPAPPTATEAIELKPGTQLAMAFKTRTDGGESSVHGRRENVLQVTPTKLDIKIAHGGFSGTLSASIYPARAPGDARPRPGAPALTTVSVPILALPAGTLRAVAIESGSEEGGEPLVFDTSRVISGTHLAPTTTVPLAITGLAAPLDPGVAYTIVLSVEGTGTLSVLAANADPGGARNDFMMRTAPTDRFLPMGYAVPFTLTGNYRLTGTTQSTVVRQVHITLDPSDGAPHVSSAGVYGQVLAEDPWLGVVPHETP